MFSILGSKKCTFCAYNSCLSFQIEYLLTQETQGCDGIFSFLSDQLQCGERNEGYQHGRSETEGVEFKVGEEKKY